MIRVLITLTYYSPYVSGLTMYVKRLSEHLDKRRFSVRVLTMRHTASLKSTEIINQIPVIRASYFAKISKGFLSFNYIWKSLQEVRTCDVVVINLPQPEGLFPALFASLFRKKLVSIYHCDVVLPRTRLNQMIEAILDGVHRVILKRSDTIVNNSFDFAKNSRILPQFLGKTIYIYPPIYFPKIDKRIQNIIGKKIKGETFYSIGIVTRIAAEKGLEYVLEAIPRIRKHLKGKPFRIFLAGPESIVGEDAYRRMIMKLMEKYKEYILYLGQLDDHEMGAFYSLLDVLAVPSVNSTEAFGMVQIEAMSLGVPVVATDLPGVRVPIQKSSMGIIVPPYNSEKLAQAITMLLTKRSSYRRFVPFVRREFSIGKTIGEFRKVLGG
ncbi:glycosyltransferase family 4 protein [Candidatus Gottesmanbacteria bacterium]|nr:glycosyltransferase family 4 protein [Candidatus Gottesmanbacteria bacterium]